MATRIIIRSNEYYDSVVLMSLSSKVLDINGVSEAFVSMATKMNKELLKNVGLYNEEVEKCGDNDLVIAIEAKDEKTCDEALKLVDRLLKTRNTKKDSSLKQNPKTIPSAIKELKNANLTVISVPGKHAYREARKALNNDLNVMIFSDNVSITEEKKLKELAREKGLLVMGPDCGTAILNNVGICFANKVRKGNIGLVAASGTGLQEVTVLIDKFGGGISQAIGTGGRDLDERIGGITMIEGIKALNKNKDTDVIVLISKPPAKSVELKIMKLIKDIKKPVIVCFIDGNPEEIRKVGAEFGHNLEETALKAVKFAGNQINFNYEDENRYLKERIKNEKSKLKELQVNFRALYCGGTLCSESLALLRNDFTSIKCNVSKRSNEKLTDFENYEGNVLLDLGEDHFTIGKPHPMIEPSLRNERILKEAKDPTVGVILLDFELGYGCHSDPVGVTLSAIRDSKQIAKKDNRNLIFVGYVCGTTGDYQDVNSQIKKLEDEGVIVARSNAHAANIVKDLLA